MDKKSDSNQDLEQFYRLLADYGLTGNTQRGKAHLRDEDEETSL